MAYRKIGDHLILGDTSQPKFRPYAPVVLRDQIMSNYHSLSHPGIRPSQKLIMSDFIWHGAANDVRNFVKSCVDCQTSKVQRHSKHLVQQPDLQPTSKFSHVHVDIVGALADCGGMKYLLTVVDRATRYPVAVPMPDITADTVVKAFMSGWVAHFGVPHTIVSDRGRQFTSKLWADLVSLLGMEHNPTTAFHPESNGMVERFHRTLKSALMAGLGDNRDWLSHLPIVLLGIRSSVRGDFGCSTNEVGLGQELALPGSVFDASDDLRLKHSNHYLFKAVDSLVSERRHSPRHGLPDSWMDPSLKDCTFVFFRDDTVKPNLTRPYRGPFKVLEKNSDHFTLQIRGKSDKVSVNRLKPAFLPSLFSM